MPLSRQDLVNDPNWVIPHDPAELTHVEIWEFENEYYIWDKVNNELDELDHAGHKDFMDAAMAAEDDIIADAPQAQRAALRQAVRANVNHRKGRMSGRKRNVHTELPTGSRGRRGGRS